MSAAPAQENETVVPPRSRPEVLFPIFAPVTALKGVGPRIGKNIERLVGEQVVNLLWHMPSGLIDRRYSPALSDLEPGRVATLELTVNKHHPPPAANRRIPYRIDCSDETGEITLIYFHGRKDYLSKALGRKVQLVFADALSVGLKETKEGADIIIGKDSVVRADATAAKQKVKPLSQLTYQPVSTIQCRLL